MSSPRAGGSAPARIARAIRNPSLYVGFVSIALGGVILRQAWGTAFFVPGLGTGAMAFPLVIGLGFVAVGLLVVGRALLGVDAGSPVAWPGRAGRTRLLGLVASTAAYVVMLEKLGFLLSNVLFGLAALTVLGRYRWWVSALVAVGIAVGASVVFETALGVNLPRGALPWGGR